MTATTAVDWQTIERDTYTVKYAPGYESDGQTIDEYMQYARSVVDDSVYPHTLSEPIDVELYPEEEYGRSQYSMGYYSSERTIQMMTPTDNDRYGPDSLWYKKNVVHEYVHVPQVDDKTAGDGRLSVPGWFKEGHAEYVAVYETTDEIRQKYEDYPGHNDAIDRIEASEGYLSTVASRKYAGGKILFRYLADWYGLPAIADVFDGTAADNYTQAVQNGLGITPLELQVEWLGWAEDNIGGTYDQTLCEEGSGDGGSGGGGFGGRQCGGIVDENGEVDAQGVLRAIRAYNNDEKVVEDSG